MKRLAPGVYDDERGGLHLDLAELLTANGFADTPANRALMIQTWRDWGAEQATPVQVTITDEDLDEAP